LRKICITVYGFALFKIVKLFNCWQYFFRLANAAPILNYKYISLLSAVNDLSMLSLSVISSVEIHKLFYDKLCTLSSMPEHDWLSRKLPYLTSYILPQLPFLNSSNCWWTILMDILNVFTAVPTYILPKLIKHNMPEMLFSLIFKIFFTT